MSNHLRVGLRAAKHGLRTLCWTVTLGRPASSVRNLMYHSVDDSGSTLSVAPSRFRTHLRWLREHGWRGLTSAHFIARLEGAPGQPKEVFISFDDGYVNFIRTAAPILADLGFPATVFVPCDMVGQHLTCFTRDRHLILARCHNGESNLGDIDKAIAVCEATPLMKWEQLATLRNFDIDVQSHSAAHQFLTRLPTGSLLEDLQRSRRVLQERLGVEADLLAYPYGDWDERVRSAAQAAGFRGGVLANRVGPRKDPLAIGRMGLNDSISLSSLAYFLSCGGEYEDGIRSWLGYRSASYARESPP